MKTRKNPQLPAQQRLASIVPATIDEGARTVEVVWSTGAAVRRYDWWEDEVYEETLSFEPGHVRMDRMQSGSAPCLLDHVNSTDNVVGVIESATIGNGEGRAVIRLDGGDPAADALWRKVSTGILRNISVGYSVYRYEVTREDGKLPVYRATDWEPHEVSLVAVPADAGAGVRDGGAVSPCQVIERAQRPGEKKERAMDDEENGVESAAVDTTAAAAAVGGEGVERTQRSAGHAGNNNAGMQTVQADRAAETAVAAERKRVAEINALVRQHGGLGRDWADRHIAEGTAVDAVRSDALKVLGERDSRQETRGQIRMGASDEDPATVREAMVRAIAHSMSPGGVKLEGLAQKYRGYRPLAMAEEVVSMAGIRPESRSPDGLVRAAFHSTSDFPLLLADAGNMVLQGEYELANPAYRQIASMRSFNDFKPTKFLTAGDFPDLLPLKESGEIKAGTMSEGKETVTLESYARMIGLTRQAMVNDSLGAFADFPRLAARRISVKENALVFAVLSANAGAGVTLADGVALFHADHGNRAAAGTVINVTNLGKARAAMRKQQSIDGLPLNISASILLVGPDKETEAEQVTASIIAAATGEVNPFSGKLSVVTDASIAGNKWYTFANPADAEVLVYGYLNGQSAPQLAVKEGWSVDGVEFRIIHDFAAGAIDHRGAYYNAGA